LFAVLAPDAAKEDKKAGPAPKPEAGPFFQGELHVKIPASFIGAELQELNLK